MSEWTPTLKSDAGSGWTPSVGGDAPKPKPKAQAKPQTKPDPWRSSVYPMGKVSTVPSLVHPTKAQLASQRAVEGGVSEFLGYGNTIGTMIGAAMRDQAEGRNIGDTIRELSSMPISGTGPSHSHLTKAFNMLSQGHSIEAGEEYFPTSATNLKALASHGEPMAKYLHGHPRQASIADFFVRAIDPSNAIFGEGMGMLGRGARGMLGEAGGAAARTITRHAPQAAAHPIVQHLASLGEQTTFNRFADVRAAAQDVARTRGVNPHVHADEAEQAARNMANVDHFAAGWSQRMTRDVFKGLTKSEQDQLVDLIEGESALIGKKVPLSAAGEALKKKLMPRLQMYRKYRGMLDDYAKANGVADPTRFLAGDNYFPRKGMFKNMQEAGEDEDPVNEAFLTRFRSRGGSSVRKETLGENVHRRYRSRVDALRNGAVRDENTTAAEIFERHAYVRLQAARINEQLNHLQKLGLITPKEVPVPHSAGVMQEVSAPPGQFPFTDTYGSLRSFGSQVTRPSYAHPAVAHLLEDIAGTTRSGFQRGLSHITNWVAGPLRFANRLASLSEVSDPLWHPFFNISETTASEAPNVLKYAKGVGSKQARESAEMAGVHLPHVRQGGAADWARPFSDLSPQEKLMRVLKMPARGVEAISSDPLYGFIEPRMATGTYEGLKKRLGPAGAMIATRSTLGEPENFPSALRDVGQMAQFPTWMLSQLRRWIAAPIRRPWLYNSPHASIEHYNESRGRGPQPGDATRFIPPIMLGTTPEGDRMVLELPHPGDRTLRMEAAIGNAATGKGLPEDVVMSLAGGANPILSPQLNKALTAVKREDKPSDVAHDFAMAAPQRTMQQKVMDWAKFYMPGVGQDLVHTELSQPRSDQRYTIMHAFIEGDKRVPALRHGIAQWRKLAQYAADQGRPDLQAQATKEADSMWNVMNRVLKARKLPTGDEGMDNPASWGDALKAMTRKSP